MSQVTISERVYEHREWEIHHRRWTMHHLSLLIEGLGSPNLVASHGGLEGHLARMRTEGEKIFADFEARYQRGRHMTAVQLRADR